ncbi:MAG TPA: hypothetical protein VFJ30_00650 [Phycisphaerae bacterium]|nr:hypothetical protein [Phycisphaerae bacterium]
MRLLLTMTLTWFAAAAPGQTPPPVTPGRPALAPRYVSVLNGFSICPPAETERVRETSRRRLVAWTQRDPATGAIRMSMEVIRTLQLPTTSPLDQHARDIATRLLATSRLKVESTEIGTLAGKPAMHFRGMTEGELKLWCRQTWVKIRVGTTGGPDDKLVPDEHLVFNLTGPADDKARLDAMMTASLATLQLFDPVAARREGGENLARGAEALAGWTEAKLRPLLSSEPVYYTMHVGGRVVGFLRVTETIGRPFDDATGLAVVRWGCLKAPNEPRRLIHEELFCTADQRVERWRHAILTGEGPGATRVFQEGIKQGNVLLVGSRSRRGPATSTKHVIPDSIIAGYMPAAMSAIATQLIDRTQGRAYGFAVFNPVACAFDLRTIRVVGPATLRGSGGDIQATRLTDQKADDAPVVDVWVDAAGRPLRTQAPEGLVIQRAAPDTVVKLFAAELIELEKLGRAARRSG